MEVMLINPTSKAILNNAGDRPPIGLLSIASAIMKHGHKVRVRDMDHYSEEDLIYELDNNPPDVAGISVYTSPLYDESIKLSILFRDRGIKIIAGGYHASAMPSSLYEFFDAIIIGEGEEAFPKLLNDGVPSITINSTPIDLNNIERPNRALIEMNNYTFKQDGRRASTTITSRGCPNNCVFCGNMNKKVRFNSDEFVIDEIQDIKSYGINDIYFLDDAFTTHKKRTLKLLHKIKQENINFRITTRAKLLDDDIVKVLKEAGCTWVSMGIESGSDDRLKDVCKNMTTSDNYEAVKLLTKHEIKSKGFFMFGLPNESLEDAEKTIQFSLKLKEAGLTSADFYIMTPFPGSAIWKTPEKFGIEIIDRDYTKYLEAGKEPTKAFHRTKFMNQKQIEEVRNRAEREWNV